MTRVPAPLAALATTVLLGCATGQPVTHQVVVSGANFDAVQGEAALIVRSHITDAERGRLEVLGADCRVTSSLYEASLVTPARLVVPNFGPQSPQIDVACRAGELAGQGQVQISTFWRYPPGYYPYAPYPAGVWGWQWGWPGGAYPVSEYPDLNVELR